MESQLQMLFQSYNGDVFKTTHRIMYSKKQNKISLECNYHWEFFVLGPNIHYEHRRQNQNKEKHKSKENPGKILKNKLKYSLH